MGALSRSASSARAPRGWPSAASPVRSSVAVAFFAIVIAFFGIVGGLGAQDVPVLQGRVLVADTPLDRGTVVLHEVTALSQGDLDSTSVDGDGSFRFELPAPPDPSSDQLYFASIRHAGILYFGAAVNAPAQLDSIYEIQAYDTLMVPSGGTALPLQARNIFFEPSGDAWEVTDIFQVRNDETRTLVAADAGRVWSYPLPPGARNFRSGQGELSLDGTSLENDTVSVRAAIAPGERVFVMRYALDDPFLTLPTPGVTGALDLLVREPASAVGVEGLEFVGRVELEEGSTYRRYTGVDVVAGAVSLVESEAEGQLPVRWFVVILTLVLAGAGVMAFARGGAAPVSARAPQDRQSLLLEIARLDDDFESNTKPSKSERTVYEARRTELISRVRALP